MILQIITICISVVSKFRWGTSGNEEGMEWVAAGDRRAARRGGNVRAVVPAGRCSGKFDASGEVCFSLPELDENYVSATLHGVTDARLLDGQNRRIRTLIENGPADGNTRCCLPCR